MILQELKNEVEQEGNQIQEIPDIQVQLPQPPIIIPDRNNPAVPKKQRDKETMLHEPLPIFDCMYCVKDSMKVFQKVADKLITDRYGSVSINHESVIKKI